MRRAIVLATLAALALPTAASAKEVAALTVCGSNGCHKITAHAALQGFMNGGYETLAPERAAPFFTVKVAMRHAGDDAGGWTVEYLRATNLIRATADYSKHVWTRPAGSYATFSMCANTTPLVPRVQETIPSSTIPLPTALDA